MSVGLILKEMPERCVECPVYNSCDYFSLIKSKSDNCPLQELELVPHGIYKMIVDDSRSCWFNECSICGNRIEFGHMLQPYCPKYGAKMEGWRVLDFD